MTFDPTNPLPQGLTEGDVLAFIEGELSVPDATRVRQALAGGPNGTPWLQVVESMAADRSRLSALETPAPPARVMAFAREAVRDIAARQMIVEPDVHEIPVSRAGPEQPGVLASVIDFFANQAWARTTAAAAGFMLAGSIIVWGAMNVFSNMTSGPTLANNNGEAVEVIPAPAPPPVDVAVVPEPDGLPVDEGTLVAIDDTPAATPEVPDITIAADTMSITDALALAIEHRLVLVVETPDASRALARIDNVRRTSGRHVTWHALPSTIESEVRVAMDTRAISPDEFIPAFAGENEPGTARDNPFPLVTEEISAAYSVTLDQTARDLEILQRTLRQRNLDARFIAIDEPVTLADQDALDPDALFWWTRAPEHWAPKMRVPIVIKAID